jgi:O-antigen/teichoic acid export membrane protein
MSNLVKDSVITLITRGLVFVMAMANSIIVSRVLGPAIKGSYGLITLTIGIASLLVTLGLGSANVYYGARNSDELPTLAGNSLLAGLGTGCIGVIIVELLSLTPSFQAYFLENNIDVRLIRAVILILPLMKLDGFFREIIRASGDILRYNFLALWGLFSSLLGNVVLVWGLNLGLRGAIIAWGGSTLSVTLLTLFIALKTVHYELRFDVKKLIRNLKFGVRLYPGNIAQFLNYRLDVFFVGFFLQPVEVGWYVTATALAEKLWEIPHAIRTVLLYQVAATEDQGSANQTTARVSRVIFLIIGCICLSLLVLRRPLIYFLYGEAYAPSATALVFLIPGIWGLSIGKLLAIHLAGQGKPEVGTFGALISLVSTVTFDVLLIPRLGINGAAAASSISYTLSSLVILGFFLKTTRLQLKDVFIVRRRDFKVMKHAFLRTLHHITGWVRP